MLEPGFFDDFSDPDLARYYEILPGVGSVARTTQGLEYQILRAPDGPSSAQDHLTIDTLGRPQSPTIKAVMRFAGVDWTMEALLEYDFDAKRNGRAAYLWIVFGEPGRRDDASIALVRSADLDPASHNLTVVLHHGPDEPQAIALSSKPGARQWYRIIRKGSACTVSWSEDGETFTAVLEHEFPGNSEANCVILNSSSFAGGASFRMQRLSLRGAAVLEAAARPAPLRIITRERSSLHAEELLSALRAGRDIDVQGCVITGPLDLGNVAEVVTANIRIRDCEFTDALFASNAVKLAGDVGLLNCQFALVGLSNVEFTGGLRFVGSHFQGDTRFIDTQFQNGANFSGCIFAERPFFRIARAAKPVSFYHANFGKGADFSSTSFDDDVSFSDVAVTSGSLSFYRARVAGTLRFMTTLQRDTQPLGSQLELSSSELGTLVISAGDRRNRGEYTGPARWDVDVSVFLREARIRRFELYNVHFAKAFDLSSAVIDTVDLENATFAEMIGAWPVATEFYSCFISYSSKDQAFAERLHTGLTQNGVTSWFAPHDMKIGDVFRQRIDDEIRRHDKLLLILSEHSVQSAWVREEVEACMERERDQKRQVLFPIRLDEAVMRTTQAWAASIRRQRHIGDFSKWNEEDAYETGFRRLLRDLKAH